VGLAASDADAPGAVLDDGLEAGIAAIFRSPVAKAG
jgi:hypothetical protein